MHLLQLLMILFLCDSIFTSTTINDDDEIAERICERKFQTLLPWEYPQKFLKTAEDIVLYNVNGENLIMGARTPYLIKRIASSFDSKFATEFSLARYAFAFNSETGVTLAMIHEDSSDKNGEEVLLLSAYGDFSKIYIIMLLIFDRLPNSKFSYTGNPANQFSKTMQALGFKIDEEYAANPYTGERLYLRPSKHTLLSRSKFLSSSTDLEIL